jgi:hypothetical protein
MRLPKQSSPGVRPSYTVYTRRLRHRSLDRRHLSWGFTPLQRSRRRESTSRPVARWAPRFCRGVRRRIPIRRLRRRSQVFPTSQRLVPLPAVPPFSDGWRSWGSPFRGFILPQSPDDFSSPEYPRDVPPTGCATPILGGGARRHDDRCLGDFGRRLLPSTGFSAPRKSICALCHF